MNLVLMSGDLLFKITVVEIRMKILNDPMRITVQ